MTDYTDLLSRLEAKKRNATDEEDEAAEAIKALVAERDRLSELCDKWNAECDEFRDDNERLAVERDKYKEEHMEACHLVADMHWAAMGEVVGPKRGVIEDIADLKTERDYYKQALDELGVTPAEARKGAERSRAKDALITKLTTERDELLAALEKIERKCNLDMHGDDGSLGGYAFGIWQTANAAIANTKGER